MTLRNAPADGKPKPKPVRDGIVAIRLQKAVKQVVKPVGAHASAGIGNDDLDRGAVRLYADAHAPARRREFERIGQKVHHQLLAQEFPQQPPPHNFAQHNLN